MKISLKACRINADLTQQEMADAMGVSKPTIIAWETGQRQVKPAYLPMISQVTGIPIDCISLPCNFTKSKAGGKE